MTNQSSPVWQMAYMVKLAKLASGDSFSPLESEIARDFADAAVESIGDAQPQQRDESRDVWIDGDVACGVAMPGWERYVQYSRLEAALADVSRLKAALNRDRTGLAAALERINRTCVGYRWIPEGEWASYDYTQQTKETLRAEVGNCLDAVCDIAMTALKESGDVATRAIRNEPSDSDLLDAILEAYSCSEYEFSVAIKSAIAERAKR